MDPVYFASQAAFRRWLQQHSASTASLWVGLHRVGSGKKGITWPQAVDQALCFGWIDGLRKRIDADRYMIRFTARRKGSVWSKVNIERAEALIKRRLMRAAGRAAFEARRENRSGLYSYEQRLADLPQPYAAELRKHAEAARWFASQPASYRRAAVWWVVSARQEATRWRRLGQLVADSARGRRIAQFIASRRRTPGAAGSRGSAR